jgi:hypothetical protein
MGVLPLCAAAWTDGDIGMEVCHTWWQFQVWLVKCQDTNIMAPQLVGVVDPDAGPVLNTWDELRVVVVKLNGHPFGAVSP